MVAGPGDGLCRAPASMVLQGKAGGVGDRRQPQALSSELLVVLSRQSSHRLRNERLPVALSQVARYAAPQNSAASVMLALMLEPPRPRRRCPGGSSRVPPRDPLVRQARDAEVRALIDADRQAEALQVAQRAVSSATGVSDYARLGDVLASMKRHEEAAAAYAPSAAAHRPNARPEERWPLLLLQASALEEANRWPETRQLLTQALALAPDQPLILNFLGYAKLERGEDLDAAEAMIRKASELAPDDASITDSLGWAQYKRGQDRTKRSRRSQRPPKRDPDPGGDPGASWRRLYIGQQVRGALRLERGAGHRGGRRCRAAKAKIDPG